jgi:hypothetical protein
MDIAVMRPALDDPGQTNVAAPVSTNTPIRKTRPLLGSKASRHAGFIAYASEGRKATRVDAMTVRAAAAGVPTVPVVHLFAFLEAGKPRIRK